MSRLIKQTFPTENTYVEFRFESSLRKYEPLPSKKVKGNEICQQGFGHHTKRNCSISPARGTVNLPRGRTPGKENTVERWSRIQKSDDRHLVSSNKTIRLSRPKHLEEISSNKNHLEMKIYASLVNISRMDSKPEKSGQKSYLDEEVYLNDFEPSECMDEEKECERDKEFGRIQIGDKSDIEMGQERRQTVRGQEIEDEKDVNQFQQVSQEVIQESMREQGRSVEYEMNQKGISVEMEKLSVEEIVIKALQKVESVDQSVQIDQIQKETLMVQPMEPFRHQNSLNQVPDEQSEFESESQHSLHQRGVIREHSCEQSYFSSRNIEENRLSDSMMDKCLAFQGGRIYIDSSGQNFYISVRVFNKMRRQCCSTEDLLSALIRQRPYLECSRDQIRSELEQYLQKE